MELFTLLFKTDNRKIYSGNNMVILGKVQNENIKIFSLISPKLVDSIT